MQTTDFIKKYFHVPVEGQWLVEKKPSQRWKNNKSLYYNDSTKGILLFYEKP